MLGDGSRCTVVSIQPFSSTEDVFNLYCPPVSTFVADNVVVHNGIERGRRGPVKGRATVAAGKDLKPISQYEDDTRVSDRPRSDLNRPRKAIVIGNGEYDARGWESLHCVRTDVDKVQHALLQDARFDSATLYRDLGKDDMMRRFIGFCQTIKKDEDVLVYFGGHGLMCGQNMYLIPTDAPGPQLEALTPGNIDKLCCKLDDFVIRLARTEARLKMFIIDASADRLDTEGAPLTQPSPIQQNLSQTPRPGLEGPMPRMPARPRNIHITTTKELYTDPLGQNIILLQSAADGCSAMSSYDIGGWFTDSFMHCIKQKDTTLGNLHARIVKEMVTNQKKKQCDRIQIPQQKINTLSDDKLLSLRFFQQYNKSPVIVTVSQDR